MNWIELRERESARVRVCFIFMSEKWSVGYQGSPKWWLLWIHEMPSINKKSSHASFCWQALWRCWFHFPAGLGTCPHCQRYQKLVQWPWCYCAWLASKLAWPEPHRESMGYCQEEDERHQTQQCRWAEGRYQRNLGFHTTSAVPQTDHLHATPNWGSN